MKAKFMYLHGFARLDQYQYFFVDIDDADYYVALLKAFEQDQTGA